MKLSRGWLGLVFGMAAAVAPQMTQAGTEDLVVIANPNVAMASATREQLRPIFQTKTAAWPDGSAVRPFNLPETVQARQDFDSAVLNLDPDRVARYWIDRKIRGGERPPANAPSAQLMVRLVAATPGGVGYAPASAVTPQVKVLARIHNGQVVAP